MDIFDRLTHLNQKRTTDTADETAVLQAMRAIPAAAGTLGDLKVLLPDMDVNAIHHAVRNLAIRGKARIVPGHRWQLAE